MNATVVGLFFIAAAVTVNAQQYNSVPLEHEVYGIIENAVLRGIIPRPPSAKPWQEFTIRQLLREILSAEPGFNFQTERDIVSALLAGFERKPGLDIQRGAHYLNRPLPKDSHYSLDTGMSWESNLNVTGTGKIATVNMGTVYLDGDIGNYLSYDFKVRAGILRIDRDLLGERPTAPYFDPKDDDDPRDDPAYIPSYSPVFSLPANFPYSFTKPWEAAVFKPKDLSSYGEWPDSLAFGYEIISEIGTGLVDNRLQFRFGRMRRDWGPGETGKSLFMNGQARPFMALEGTIIAAPWMYFSFLTGALEYQKINDQWVDAASFQSLFSLAMLEFNSKEHFHFDFGSATIWPKRFDLGYVFPVNSNFFYQNNIGDFDNLALFANLEYRLPGIGKIWGSLFVDEINLKRAFFILDREMYALQGGIKVLLPWLPFASVTLQYTKVEPYCYTHEYTSTPWHSTLIDTSYVNNGEPLGYYLPPNSDEILLRLESMILPEAKAHVQYQLIRHGVEYGPGRVDGSSLQDKIIKNNNTEKYFLRDGVYQWNHVVKIGGSYSFKTKKIPISLYGDFGIVVTQFTDTGVDPKLEEDHFFHFTSKDDPDYKPSVGVIFSVGFKIFP
ncbi:MAG: hypothetical protein LBC60_00740 [Spirochaetaceae bacterium]|nr:hypothetical protein [Spirochaetaceae bacterium]